MARVYLGLGSNIRPAENLRLGIQELASRYGDLDLSPVYLSAAVGFEGDDFLNLVVGLDSEQPPTEMHRQIETIHKLAGRQRGGERYTSRPLDIDLLLYDDRVIELPGFRLPRDDVLKYSFVLRPLFDLEPDLRHPETGRTMREHWQAFGAARQPLKRVDVIL